MASLQIEDKGHIACMHWRITKKKPALALGFQFAGPLPLPVCKSASNHQQQAPQCALRVPPLETNHQN
eukprot:310508-Ditylum_brightwellii.AAC.1